MPYDNETGLFYQSQGTKIDGTPDGDTVKEGFVQRTAPSVQDVYADMNLLRKIGAIGMPDGVSIVANSNDMLSVKTYDITGADDMPSSVKSVKKGLESKADKDLTNVTEVSLQTKLNKYFDYRCIYGTGQAPVGDENIEDDNLGVNGTINANTAYYIANPFGKKTPVFAMVDLFLTNVWQSCWGRDVYVGSYYYDYKTKVLFGEGYGLCVHTGMNGVMVHEVFPTRIGEYIQKAPCRVHVWKLKGEI